MVSESLINNESTSSNDICIGIVIGAHGISGNLKVKVFTEKPENIALYSYLFNNIKNQTFEIESIKSIKNDIAIIKFKGIISRNMAEELKGNKLYINRDSLTNTSDNVFYYADLINLTVYDENKFDLGKVLNIHNFGASDIIEVKYNENTFMVPFKKNFIEEVNLSDKFIVISKEGLLNSTKENKK